jgi:hypothetical protein
LSLFGSQIALVADNDELRPKLNWLELMNLARTLGSAPT